MKRTVKPMGISAAAGNERHAVVNPSDSDLNCQSCVLAYEMRRRGLDVAAKPRGVAGTVLAIVPKLAFTDTRTGKCPDEKYYDAPPCVDKASIEALAHSLASELDAGRYALSWQWVGADSGHIVNLEKTTDGKLILVDAQTGERATGTKGLWEYFRPAIEAGSGIEHVSLFRTDNAAIEPLFFRTLQAAAEDCSPIDLALKQMHRMVEALDSRPYHYTYA